MLSDQETRESFFRKTSHQDRKTELQYKCTESAESGTDIAEGLKVNQILAGTAKSMIRRVFMIKRKEKKLNYPTDGMPVP